MRWIPKPRVGGSIPLEGTVSPQVSRLDRSVNVRRGSLSTLRCTLSRPPALALHGYRALSAQVHGNPRNSLYVHGRPADTPRVATQTLTARNTVPHIPARDLQPGMVVAFRELITGVVESVTIEGELARIVLVIRWLADETVEVTA